MNRSVDNSTGDLIGVVMCGGESRRMGRDKGLIERDGVVWAARVGQALAARALPVVYSIRAVQEVAYAAALPGAVLIKDEMDIGGPLNGLFSVHRRFVDRDLLLLACDMQEIDEGTIGELIGEYKNGGAEFYTYCDGESVQPFCAVYTAGGLERVLTLLDGERSLRSVIGKGVVRRLAVRRKEAFGNYNSL